MMDRVMHRMMNDMAMMNDMPLVMHRMVSLCHCKAGQRKK
jgi:hypothetical protein